MDEVRYLISDASKKVDVETHVLRYWEEELGISIPRNELGHRYYTEFHIRLFCQVKELKDKGYQLKAIKNALQQVMGPEQEQKIQRSMEPDRKIREAASLLEQDIARTLQADPRLKGSLRLSLDKTAVPDNGPRAAKDLGPAITYLSDYSRLEAGVVCVGMDPGVRPRAEDVHGEESQRKKEQEKEVLGKIEEEKQENEELETEEQEKGEREKRAQRKEEVRKRIEDIEDSEYEEKVEKDGRMDMKNKGKSRKKPSAWERRNGVVSGTSTKGDELEGIPRSGGELRGVSVRQEENMVWTARQEGNLSRAARQGEILARAVRKEGAGKACVDRIIGRKEERGEKDQEEIVTVLDGGREKDPRSTVLKEDRENGSMSPVMKETERVDMVGPALKEAGEKILGGPSLKESEEKILMGPTLKGAREKGTKRVILQDLGEESRKNAAATEAEMSRAKEAEGKAGPSTIAQEEAAVTALAVQEDIEDTDLAPMTQEEKLEQFQMIMDHIIGKALEANNEKLSQDISRLVNDELVEELSDLMRIRDEREEERFRHLDETIRSCQRDRLGKAEAAATRIPFFRRKRYGRNGRALG